MTAVSGSAGPNFEPPSCLVDLRFALEEASLSHYHPLFLDHEVRGEGGREGGGRRKGGWERGQIKLDVSFMNRLTTTRL